jgi:sugar phosphate isomerase/epimerase
VSVPNGFVGKAFVARVTIISLLGQDAVIEMECGIVLHGSNMLGVREALEEISNAGFESFEFSFGHVHRMEEAGAEAFSEAVSASESFGLDPVQLHGPSLEMGFDLASPEEGIRKSSVDRSGLWIQHCAALGVPVMVEHGCEFHDNSEATMERMKRSFRQLAQIAREHGVKVAIENEFDPRDKIVAGEGRNMVVPARVGCMMSELLEVVEDVDPDYLGVCLDFGHANMQSPLFSIDEAIGELGEFLIATHLHDNEGASDQHLIPLMGSIEWQPAIAALADIGYDRPLILELGGTSTGNAIIRTNRLRLYRAIGLEITRGF